MLILSCQSFSEPKTLSHDVGASPSCKPVKNVLFLKVHKTGSSTLTNILNRYGDSRDLVFALPNASLGYDFGWPEPFLMNSTLPLKRAPNILCNHAVYNKVAMNCFFPKETTRYITILRDPSEQFESIFNYYHVERWNKVLLESSSPLETFLSSPEKYYHGNRWLIKNPSLLDLGLYPLPDNVTELRDYVHFLQQELNLVLLNEYFDESLVLLKRRFCWEIEDILYFKLNERTDEEKGTLTSDARQKIRKWNWGDVLLYDVFNQTLWEMIAQEGPEFYNDLALFRKEMKAIKKACLKRGHFLTSLFVGKVVLGYELKTGLSKELNETCSKMIMNEWPYVDYLRQKMLQQGEVLDAAL